MHELRSSDTPPKVVLNEAVDLAKKFSGEDSGAFVNGILDTFRKSLNPSSCGPHSTLTRLCKGTLKRVGNSFHGVQSHFDLHDMVHQGIGCDCVLRCLSIAQH